MCVCVDFPQLALQLPRNGGFNWPVSSRELAGSESTGIAIPRLRRTVATKNRRRVRRRQEISEASVTSVGSHSVLRYRALLYRDDEIHRWLRSPAIQKRPINARRDARPPHRDGKSFGAYTLFTPRVTRATRKFREIRQIVPLACAHNHRACMYRTYVCTHEGGRGTHTAALS